jgi:hypothetical protein
MTEMSGGTYRYIYSNNEFKLYEADGTTAVSGAKFWVEVYPDGLLHAIYNGQDKGALTKQTDNGSCNFNYWHYDEQGNIVIW